MSKFVSNKNTMENNFILPVSQCAFQFPDGILCPPSSDFFPVDDAKALSSGKSSRGRKKLRPGNPLKTEVLDKFWFRLFTNFVKSNILDIQAMTNNPEYWSWYLKNGKPGKKSNFLSYNSKYKQMLFANRAFSSMFAAWGLIYGTMKTPNKILKASWEYYYQYLFKELIPQAFDHADQEEIRIYYIYICNSIIQNTVTENQTFTLNSSIDLDHYF